LKKTFYHSPHHLACIVALKIKREINKKISLYFHFLIFTPCTAVVIVVLLLPYAATSYDLQHKEQQQQQHVHKGKKASSGTTWVCCMRGVGVGRPLIN
jgi:hypothetical protein